MRLLLDTNIFLEAGVTIIALSAQEMEGVIQVAQRFGLDFEDAYQYAVAERYGLTIISFDGDFDRTARGRKTPEDLIFGVRGTSLSPVLGRGGKCTIQDDKMKIWLPKNQEELKQNFSF